MLLSEFFLIVEHELRCKFDDFKKPVYYVWDESQFSLAWECPMGITLNVARIVEKCRGLTLLQTVRFIVSVFAHELIGHCHKPLPRVSIKAQKILEVYYDEKDWTTENIPVHLQMALVGDKISERILIESGYREVIITFLIVCRNVYLEVRNKMKGDYRLSCR